MSNKTRAVNAKLAGIVVLIIVMCVFMATILRECAIDTENIMNRPTGTPEDRSPENTPTTEVTGPSDEQESTLTPSPEPTPTIAPITGPGGNMSTHKDYYGKKVIALTFDDGPHKSVTDKLLDGLKERGVKATFFVTAIGTNTSDWDLDKRILTRMIQEGHEIGNHTQSHRKLTQLTNEEIKKELTTVNERVKEMTGYDIRLFRPPTGAYEKRVIELSGMAMVHFTLDSNDWRYLTDSALNNYAKEHSITYEEARKEQVQYVLDAIIGKTYDENISGNKSGKARELKHGDIILFHDTYEASADIALALIDELQDEGYVFLTVGEAVNTEGAVPAAGDAYKSIWEGYKIAIPEKWVWG